jgi:hypothetical protein
MASDPIASILAAQNPEGWWVRPGHGYSPKYTGTTWSLMFLGQLGADGTDPRVRAACEYVLDHTQTAGGGFGCAASGTNRPAPSSVVHCLNGNLLRALIGFGWLDDERVQRSLAWQAASVTGEGDVPRYSTTPGPGFRCGFNGGTPCAWGATKVVLGLASVPEAARTPAVAHALEAGVDLLLSCDPASANYPSATPGAKPSGSWFKLGFPCGYVTDVLQVLEALCAAGAAGDPRLGPALEWVMAQRDESGRWANRYASEGKMIRDIDRPGLPSKWVTLRACRVLKAVAAAQ